MQCYPDSGIHCLTLASASIMLQCNKLTEIELFQTSESSLKLVERGSLELGGGVTLKARGTPM